ncbi:MAG: hypothetical protein IKT20_01175 [Clostridiales bacterium]|nr:hypothetical protein [Clostridiales bacterium]
MSYEIKNKNAERLASQLTFWGAFSKAQACYFLKHFYNVEHEDAVVNQLCTNRYLCYLHGNKDVVSISNFPYIDFSVGKEKCIWVFFAYIDSAIRNKEWPRIITKNEFDGVDFTLKKKYYSLVFIDRDDKTYYSVLKTKLDEAMKYIFVVDDERRAKTLHKVNADDIIWLVSNDTISVYHQEGSEGVD